MGNIIGMIPPGVWKWLGILLGLVTIVSNFPMYFMNIFAMFHMIFTGTINESYNNTDLWLNALFGAIVISIMKKNNMSTHILYPFALYGWQMYMITTIAVKLMIEIGYPIYGTAEFFARILGAVVGFGILILGRFIANRFFVNRFYVYEL